MPSITTAGRLPFAESAGIRVTFTRLDGEDWPAVRLLHATAPEIELGFVSDLEGRIVADGARVEHEMAEAIAQGLKDAWPSLRELDPAAFVRAYDAAPPGIRSEETELPVRGPQLPEPIDVQRAAISVAERELARHLKEQGVAPGRFDVRAATQLEKRADRSNSSQDA